MDYDVLVLGGGIIGCAVAYELSKYNLNIAVIEKEYDIADDVSFVNTSIVYDGSETSNNVMAGLEYIGNILLELSTILFLLDLQIVNLNIKWDYDLFYKKSKAYIVENQDACLVLGI